MHCFAMNKPWAESVTAAKGREDTHGLGPKTMERNWKVFWLPWAPVKALDYAAHSLLQQAACTWHVFVLLASAKETVSQKAAWLLWKTRLALVTAFRFVKLILAPRNPVVRADLNFALG